MASLFFLTFTPNYSTKHHFLHSPNRKRVSFRPINVSNGGDSYLGMWKKAMDKDRDKAKERSDGNGVENLESKSNEFLKILQVSKEERDEVQRKQLIDRAAAAIAVTSTFLKEQNEFNEFRDLETEPQQGSSLPGSASIGTPGPDFWSWIPPSDTNSNVGDGADSAATKKASASPNQRVNPVMELEPSTSHLSLPFESNHSPPLPPFQSLMEVEKQDVSESVLENPQHEVDTLFSTNAEDAAYALAEVEPLSSTGTKPEGSTWWKETGTEVRADGVVCRWTLTRGVSADKSVEWEEKYWEAADELGYKELGSEKSGRDAFGNVWREFWKESMSQIEGCVHIEKTADKWGKNGKGDEWQEKWFEHYGAGQAEKWAHKWCSIDPNTPLKAGHAHVWHEKWGEKYDGQGGSVKYTDKWAERCEGDRWTKWGDKWDENFNPSGHGVKQGETWWKGKRGEKWNKTWGEGHNGSGWVHKYGKSSSGEHWDTHVHQDTWYERYPHYGFYHCFENSVPLRQVKKPSERDSS